MSTCSKHFVNCDRCDYSEELEDADLDPDGYPYPPDHWEKLSGLVMEEATGDSDLDLCLDCFEELEKWIKNGQKSKDRI